MYILNLWQLNRETNLGVFETEEEILEFLDKIPFLRKTVEEVEGDKYEYYTLIYSEIPKYFEFEYNGITTVISQFMFTENEDVDISWYEIQNYSVANQKDSKQFAKGFTRVDAYTLPNCDAERYILDREELAEKAAKYFRDKGFDVVRCFRDSEDGEAVAAVDDEGNTAGFIYLDPNALEAMKNDALENFIKEETGI